MAIRFEQDNGDGKPEVKPQSAKVSTAGQAATSVEASSETALPFGKPVRPEKKGRKPSR